MMDFSDHESHHEEKPEDDEAMLEIVTQNFRKGSSRHLEEMFNNPFCSDIKVIIYGKTLYAHLFVLCRWDYFKKAFQKYGNNCFAEGLTNTIKFDDGSEAAYWRVFEYLYKGTYSVELCNSSIEDDPEFFKDLRVFCLAEMFLITDLQSQARSRILDQFVKKRDITIAEEFVDLAREIYATTHDQALRGCVAAVAFHEVNRGKVVTNGITQSPGFLKFTHLVELIREGGDFALDYCKATDEYAGIGFKGTSGRDRGISMVKARMRYYERLELSEEDS